MFLNLRVVYNKKTFLRYGEKGFLFAFIFHIKFYNATISLLIIDQKHHDEHENTIYTLRNHIDIYFDCKDKARI